MQLDLGLTSGMPLKHIVKLSGVAEKHSVHRVWIGEDITMPHDVFVAASAILLRFNKLNVGIGITSPLVRNVSTIARAAASLSEVGDLNRFTIGLGVGGLQDLSRLGVKITNAQDTLRNAAALLKRMWEGETLSFNKESFRFRHYHPRYALGRQLSIFFGVRGPKLLRLAGEVGDGVILSGPKTYIKKAIHIVQEGIRKSERPARNFQFVLWVPTVLVEKLGDLTLVKNTIVFVLADTPREVLELAGLKSDEVNEIREVYQKHGIARASKLVTPILLEEFVIHGDSRQILENFEAFEKSGINEVVFGPPYGASPQTAVNKLAESWRRHS